MTDIRSNLQLEALAESLEFFHELKREDALAAWNTPG
jgi:hypothetical protein